jgi:hypothetical protein
MSFIIYRTQSAMSPLEKTWEEGDDSQRGAVLLALHRIDQELLSEPQTKGESRPGNVRILFEAPLAVFFKVDEVNQVVHILRTWPYRVQAHKPDYLE